MPRKKLTSATEWKNVVLKLPQHKINELREQSEKDGFKSNTAYLWHLHRLNKIVGIANLIISDEVGNLGKIGKSDVE